MPMEFVFLTVLFLPALTAITLWLLKRTKISISDELAPINYWGSYQGSASSTADGGVRLPHFDNEEQEHIVHVHPVTAHP